MGRGRAKAKQTKVARELKYSSGPLDINALTAELSKGEVAAAGAVDDETSELDEDLDDWVDEDDEVDRTGS